MTEQSPSISFDRAAYVDAGARQACGTCRGALGGEYWKFGKHVLCGSCRTQASNLVADVQKPATFARAALLGAGAALGCGVAYALFVRLMNGGQWALGTIAVGYVVARVLRKTSRGLGGVQYQVLAVALTYLASAMAFVPSIVFDLEDVLVQPRYLLAALAQLPTAPIIASMHDPLAALIIGLGLWEAWRLSRGAAVAVEGPFQVAVPVTSAPPPQQQPTSP
jgi:hypothetical protein